MRITLDWLTVKLNQDFNLDKWREWATIPLIDVETGEQLGIKCPDRYWKFNRYGGEDYISAYGIGTAALAEVIELYGLRVSRVDVAVDTVTLDPEKGLQEIEDKLNDYYDGKGINITRGSFEGRGQRGKGNRTLLYGKRSSAYQIRTYTRHGDRRSDEGWVCRIEFQLRGELARTFWDEVALSPSEPISLRNATGTLEQTIFGHHIFGIGDLEQDTVLELPKQEKMHDRERWVRSDVLKAIIRHFDETGVNLAQLLVEDFNKHITSRAIEANNDPFSPNDAENQSDTKSLNPLNYTGSKRAKVALKKYFSD